MTFIQEPPLSELEEEQILTIALLRYHVRRGHIDTIRELVEEAENLLPLVPLTSEQVTEIEKLLANPKLNPQIQSILEHLLLRHWQIHDNHAPEYSEVSLKIKDQKS